MENKTDRSVFAESYKKHGNNSLLVLIGFYKGYYLNFLLSTIFYVIKHSPVWVLPIATANIINYATEGRQDAWFWVIVNAIVLFVLVIMNVPANYLHMHFRSKAERSVEAGLRSALVHKIQHISMPYQSDLETGRLSSKIMRDVEAIETVSNQLFTNLLNICINIAVALAVTVTKSKIVFIFFIMMVPISGALVAAFRTKIRTINKNFRKEMETTSAKVIEMVEMMPVTRAHALEKKEISKMDEQVGHIAEQGYNLDIVQTNFGAVSWAIFQSFQLGCLVFTSYLALKGRIPVGDVVLYQTYFTTIVNQVSSLLNIIPTITKGLESVNSVGEVLLNDNVEVNKGKYELKDLKGSYEFKNIYYRYPNSDNDIIKGLYLSVKEGETIAFVGESGAGKTTMINLLIGFCLPTSGSLLIDGHDITEINLRTYREYLAVVPQNTVLFSGTIRENILYGEDNVSEEMLQKVIDESGLRSVVDSLPDGVDTSLGEHGGRFSGGQRQRLAIARALVRNPKVIILDEATSALDNISEKYVTGALDNLSLGRTTFIVAHRLSTIERADRIVVMKEGEIVEIGTYKELMNQKGYFYEMESR
ncbi:MAG: ABC transporter ATP-binding protein [Butyrivibrio sp.]|jgi:ATP-binding cassette subfamily B protein|nr:ABC transporter ATP-binding protein [Butyrivibrio sp.]